MVSYSTGINYAIYSYFKGGRGLHQGDPLSPLLFSLCVEVLLKSLKVTLMQPNFNFHPKCVGTIITHLAYGDDLLLFARVDESTITLIKNCIEEFGSSTRL